MIRKLTFPALAALLLTACAPQQSSAPVTQEINDSNTPLHLMQPAYETPYGIPAVADVKATMDRVLNYLQETMPATTTDGRLTQGKFRLTSYETGVTYAAMLAAARATGDQRYHQFTDDRMNLIAAQAPIERDSLLANPKYDPLMRKVVAPTALDDAGAMCAALIRLQLAALAESQQPRAEYDALIQNYVNYVMHGQFRLSNGIFARTRPHLNTVWLDDMYMGVPCIAWYGRYLMEQAGSDRAKQHEAQVYLDEAIRQIGLFRDIMWVPERQLFRHGWVESMQPHPAFHWGRANGWAILTLCEVLDALPQDYADRAMVIDLLRQHLEGLRRLQDKTGFWHQLLDDPGTYLETSCTAIYAYCLSHAICEGWIDSVTYGASALLAWNAAATQVNEQGQVANTCVGTGMGFDRAFYAYRPVHVMAAHGYGPLIWAGAEITRLLQVTHPKMNDSAVQFYTREQKTSQPIFAENEDEEELW